MEKEIRDTLHIAIVGQREGGRSMVEKLIREGLEQRLPAHIAGFISSRGLLSDLEDGKTYDIYLLDLEMLGVHGLELAAKIRQSDSIAHIIFLANHEKYAVNGYRYRIDAYILKERWKKELPYLLQKIQDEWIAKRKRFYIIETEYRRERFLIDDVLYLSKDDKYTLFHCVKERIYQERATLEQVYRRLPQREFVSIHRSWIVNLRYVAGEFQSHVELLNGERLTVSSYLLSDVRRKIKEYWGRG